MIGGKKTDCMRARTRICVKWSWKARIECIWTNLEGMCEEFCELRFGGGLKCCRSRAVGRNEFDSGITVDLVGSDGMQQY